MFEWKVNQIRADMMERVLNHMEKQGYEVQVIVPLKNAVAEPDTEGSGGKIEMLLAGKKLVAPGAPNVRKGMPAVTQNNLDVVYGRERS